MMGSMLRRGSLGDGSTLDLDFTSMSSTADLTAVGMTFSRSTSATYLNASGTVVTASANQARFNHTTAGAKRGLLFEGSATNLLCHSTRLDDAQVGSEQYWVTTYSSTGITKQRHAVHSNWIQRYLHCKRRNGNERTTDL
jgi:hypothetical protein